MARTVEDEAAVERHERRKANRYTLLLPGIVRTARQQSLHARSKDVSARGAYLFVQSDDNLLPGTELDVTLTLPTEVSTGAEALVCAHGTAVRVDKSGAGTGQIGLAVAFETCDFTRSATHTG